MTTTTTATSWDLVDKIIDEYHSLLREPEVMEAKAVAAFRQQMHDQHAIFGGRLLSPFLRPNFLTRSQFRFVQDTLKQMMDVVAIVERRALEDPGFVKEMALLPGEEELLRIEPGLRRFSAKSRMDTFLTRDSFKFVEYNAESPAGIAYGDILQNIFYDLEPTRKLRERYPIAKAHSRQAVLNTLLSAWNEWGGGTNKPRIAIVDYLNLPTYDEFVLFKEFFESQGHEATIADPRTLEYRGGKLYANDMQIDILYRRVLVNELLDHKDECKAMLDAVRDRAVCMVNTFRVKLLHKKMLFAVLWSPGMQSFFNDAQKALIRQHVPWTWRVADTKASFEGKDVDLLALARSEQQRMVLKPNDEYGGKGVIIGWEQTPEQWETALKAALDYPHVIQERVPVGRADFPDLDKNVAPRIVDLDPFILGGEVTGFLTRLSDTSLCNVTSGGGQVPTFIVEDES
jgi:uncharacterized circularly permuted ATP-grasp superfamily protein